MPVNILVVDDQVGKLLSYEAILTELGENLLKAGSAQEAFEHLLKNDVAVALIDVSMPDLDGFELAAMIRAHPRFQKISIIFVSAIALTDLDRLKGYEYGAVDYVPVPVVPDLLRAKVRVFIDLYRKTRQLEQINVELERRVQERTAELAQANAELENRVEERTREREMALAQVHEMQKLESLGQLTGGIAHDFNNVLMAIMGSLELVEKRLSDERQKKMVQVAARAATRGAKLTEQLLAYARKQRLAPEPVDLNRLMSGEAVEMLRRTLGGTVEVKTKFSQDLWTALVDPSQIELVVLNLAINARDAMPSGGSIVIETRNVTAPGQGQPSLAPGDYVLISVTDNGTGMPDDVAAKAFEPFFSTKEPGKGSGLGLSQVYGLAQQSGGGVRLTTSQGVGTCVEVYLPRTELVPESAPAANSEGMQQGSFATVLVVEDQADVREVALENLQALGYTTLAVTNGKEAITAIENNPQIDLVFTDYAMPEMSGLELARAARRYRSNLPVVIVTGYADLVGMEQTKGLMLLKKPYRLDQLGTTVERALATRGVMAAASD